MKETYTYQDDFHGGRTFTTTADSNGWVIHDDSAAGAPTVATLDGEPNGSVQLLLDDTDEAQRVSLFHGDVLSFDIDKIRTVDIVAKVQSVSATSVVLFGMSGDYNDDEDAIAQLCGFKMEGSASTSALVVETDDGATDNNDVATGETLANAYKHMRIDFTNGKSDIRFYVENSSGQLRRVASNTTFSMSNYSGCLQPMLKVEKASGTATPSAEIDLVRIAMKR